MEKATTRSISNINTCIGFGTDGIADEYTLQLAIECGYRHFDCASHYYNELSIGKVLKRNSGIRNEIHVTSKIWYSDMGYTSALQAFENTLSNLDTEYVDEYLIHWPAAADKYPHWQETNMNTWKAFEKLFKEGKIKKIGVSNFMLKHLIPLMQYAEIKPQTNQIESHPGFFQKEIMEFCQKNGIELEAWSPLGNGEILNNPMLHDIANSYDKSVAQICIRWNLQHGFLPLPKATSKDHMLANRDVDDFSITDEDMRHIDGLPFMGGQGIIVK